MWTGRAGRLDAKRKPEVPGFSHPGRAAVPSGSGCRSTEGATGTPGCIQLLEPLPRGRAELARLPGTLFLHSDRKNVWGDGHPLFLMCHQ